MNLFTRFLPTSTSKANSAAAHLKRSMKLLSYASFYTNVPKRLRPKIPTPILYLTPPPYACYPTTYSRGKKDRRRNPHHSEYSHHQKNRWARWCCRLPYGIEGPSLHERKGRGRDNWGDRYLGLAINMGGLGIDGYWLASLAAKVHLP